MLWNCFEESIYGQGDLMSPGLGCAQKGRFGRLQATQSAGWGSPGPNGGEKGWSDWCLLWLFRFTVSDGARKAIELIWRCCFWRVSISLLLQDNRGEGLGALVVIHWSPEVSSSQEEHWAPHGRPDELICSEMLPGKAHISRPPSSSQHLVALICDINFFVGCFSQEGGTSR